MVKMSLDPMQVMTGQVKELKVATAANGDGSRGSWEEKEELQGDGLGLKTAPKPVSPKKRHHLRVFEIQITRRFLGSSGLTRGLDQRPSLVLIKTLNHIRV